MTSMRCFPGSGSDSGLIARLLASEYPYNSLYREGRTHPSLRNRTIEMGRTLDEWLDVTNPGSARRARTVIKRDAARLLRGRQVKHFEVVFSDGISDDSPPSLGWYAVVTK